MARVKIGISGSYGGMNLGDEAILQGIVQEIRASVEAEITIFSRDPSDTLARHPVDHAVAVRELTRGEITEVLEALDVFILGGGGILFDGEAEIYLREVFIAHELGLPVVIYAVSAGPLTSFTSRRAVHRALNDAALVTVRDRLGYRLLEDIGVDRPIHLTADPALLVAPEELPESTLHAEGVDLGRPLIGFSVREPGPAAPDIDPEQYYALLANAADFVIGRYGAEVLFVPLEKTDVQHSHAVVAHMKNAESAEILRRRYSPGQIIDLAARFQLAVGMRLHFLIFAAVASTPLSALPYASKVKGLIEEFGFETPPLGDIGIGQLIAKIDRSWDTRAELRARINERVPKLKERAKRTNELLLAVIGDAAPRSQRASAAARARARTAAERAESAQERLSNFEPPSARF